MTDILGADQFVYGKVGGEAVTARVDPQPAVEPGDRLTLHLDTRRLHMLEPSSGMTIL